MKRVDANEQARGAYEFWARERDGGGALIPTWMVTNLLSWTSAGPSMYQLNNSADLITTDRTRVRFDHSNQRSE